MGKERGTVDIPLRLQPDFHKELTQFILLLSAYKGEKQTIKDYAIAAIKEKMERDKKEYNITLTVKKEND